MAGAAEIRAETSDNFGVERVELYDGTLLLSASSAPWGTTSLPFGFRWDTRTAADGLHTLTIRATDLAGNVTTSAPVVVTVDNTAPTVSISRPSAGAWLEGTQEVAVLASDNFSLRGFQILADKTLVAWGSSSLLSFNTRLVEDGTHELRARAYDRAWNMGASRPRSP